MPHTAKGYNAMKNTNTTAAANICKVKDAIKNGTKWTICPASNDKTLNAARIGFVPVELTTTLNAAQFLAVAHSLNGVKRGNADAVAVRPLNAIRAAWLSAKLAKEYNGRLAARPLAVINYPLAIGAQNETDAKESEYIDARRAFQRGQRDAERAALLSMVSDEKRENDTDAVAALKTAMTDAQKAYRDAQKAESLVNEDILRDIFNIA